jgi:hypothetical protein
MKQIFPLAVLLAAGPALAETARETEAHVHGHGEVALAIDGTSVLVELHAPGADVVGFEHAAETDADKAAVAAALTLLSRPFNLLQVPAAAGCSVASAGAELEAEDRDDVDGNDHDHADESRDQVHDDGAHAEFHVELVLTCTNPDALSEIAFPYFDHFANAQELDIVVVTEKGATAFEADRAASVIDLRDAR